MNQAFSKLKGNLELNQSFDDLIQQKHNAVRGVIENTASGIETKLIGSLQRKTRIQPQEGEAFDIDILVILGDFYGWVDDGITTQMAMSKLRSMVGQSERYESMTPFQDKPTVSFSYKDNVKVELVSAYRDKIGYYLDGRKTVFGRGYWIPKTGGWEIADYDYESDILSKFNQETGEYLVPTIKMLKAIKRIYFKFMSSFHLEILTTQVLPLMIRVNKVMGEPTEYHTLIKDFFFNARSKLIKIVKFPGSNTPYTILSEPDRVKLDKTFETIGTYCGQIDAKTSRQEKLAAWRKLFGSPFPVS